RQRPGGDIAGRTAGSGEHPRAALRPADGGRHRHPGQRPLLAGAVRVADWNNGSPFIVRGQAQGRNRVDLNLWPNTANFGGNVITAVKNALLYQ
ncbi:hypothetical protein K4G92_22455, partial [Mycobacterium tuberculosis]|nr:hypothetical protein [Mycobacterium tuberculosis]